MRTSKALLKSSGFLPLLLCLLASFSRPARSQEAEKPPLSADFSIGKVLDREGVALVKPLAAGRWSCAESGRPLEPGDWVQTGARGASAAKLQLRSGVRLILGPGSLVELVSAGRARIYQGDAEVLAFDAATLEVAGPGGLDIRVSGRKILRARDGRIEEIAEEPRWLAGYKSGGSTEALGSLLAAVDGRNVPLTLGYHKVTADIRDQIARTEIEESFLNHTGQVLEGVFYFPLPQEASISSFGMWIGGEFVEGEIVEKERAREIFETIRRERRDPGLLEWTGGNIFKARIYPIGGEKRIKISYVQVLPRTGSLTTYNYSLQSEMLRLHPLKELRIEARISSAEELEAVECPSHPCRIDVSAHAASAEFEAEEYAPARDFELRIRMKPRPGRVTAVAHRRAGDGYFLLLVSAPEARSPEKRSSAPAAEAGAGEPLELLILADTSGSMAGPAREAQLRFIEALLGSLNAADRFNLMTCDLAARWAFERWAPATGENRAAALAFLEKRPPLGWSDLERAFQAACERAGPRTHAIYVGDGAITAGDADPAAFCRRLQGIYKGLGTFHAVAAGSAREPMVLDAIAGLGGGSRRAIGGGSDPARAASELLREMAAPLVKGLKAEFSGLPVAAVYPETLPNLPAGSQQLILGRWDPAAGAARGKVRVTGSFEGKPVEYAADLNFAGADSGNSFLPRLWARHHLDHLLSQGASQEIREQVIALSEEYQIITPYTSFLVLESDADRERFQVKKRFRMRGGEEFFAAGRDRARSELARKQVLAVRGWRRNQRARVIEELAEMGRKRTEDLAPPVGEHGGGGVIIVGGSGLEEDTSLRPRFRLKQLTDDESESEDESSRIELAAAEGPRERSESGPVPPLRLPFPAMVEPDLYFGYGGWAQLREDKLASLFPSLGDPPPAAKEPTWPEEVLKLIRSLDRRPALAQPEVRLRLEVRSEKTDHRGRRLCTERGEYYLGGSSWLVVPPHAAGDNYHLKWLSGGERGRIEAAWLLGRTRPRLPGDETDYPEPFPWHFGSSFLEDRDCRAELQKLGDGFIELRVKDAGEAEPFLVLVIDAAKSAVLEERHFYKGNLTSSTQCSDLVQAAGAWWPGLLTQKDPDEGTTTITRIAVSALTPAEFDRALSAALEKKARAILFGKEPGIAAALRAVKEGKDRFEDRWAILRRSARSQDWEQAEPHLRASSRAHEKKPGLSRLRMAVLSLSRRHEELKGLLLEAAAGLAAAGRVSDRNDADLGAARQLLQIAEDFLSGGERRALLEAVKPVFERRKEAADPLLEWEEGMVKALEKMGREEEAFRMKMAMAGRYPCNLDLQIGYARELASRSEVEKAVSHLSEVEARSGPWLEAELRRLRSEMADLFWDANRFEELAERVEAWGREIPGGVPAPDLERYLSALMLSGRDRRARSLIEEWLTKGRKEALGPGERAELDAALGHALKEAVHFYPSNYEIEEGHETLLAETARTFIDRPAEEDFAGRILRRYEFHRTDPGRALLEELYRRLEGEVGTLPAEKIRRTVGWLKDSRFEFADHEAGWKKVFAAVFERWEKEEDEKARDSLHWILSDHGGKEMKLLVYRRSLEQARTPEDKAAWAEVLFRALREEKWSEAVEEELARLIPLFKAAQLWDDPQDPLKRQVRALYDLMTWLPEARAEAAAAALPGADLLSRRDLKAAREQALHAARARAVELLDRLEARSDPGELRPWIALERATFRVKLRERLEAVEQDLLAMLRGLLSKSAGKAAEEIGPLESVLAYRSAGTLLYLAALKASREKSSTDPPLLGLLDGAIAAGNELLDWRAARHLLLAALDRGGALEAALRESFSGGSPFENTRWGRDLAHILAERNRLGEAVEVFERLERLGQLEAADYRALAGWRAALGRIEGEREARLRSWQALGEDEIAEWLRREQQRHERREAEAPEELEAEAPLAFTALFRKAKQPAKYLDLLRSFYEATKDFRLLESLPDAVLGQTAQRICPLLERLSSVTGLIQDEAAADRIKQRLDALSPRAASVTDRRALRLLEFTVERRAGEQANGAGPHAEAALRALKESFKGEWPEGEPELMAGFLAGQGALRPEPLALERLRQLEELEGKVPPGTLAHLAVASHRAAALWAHGERELAVEALGAALSALRRAGGGLLPPSADDQLRRRAGYLEKLGRYGDAEKQWLEELAAGPSARLAARLKVQLFQSYQRALSKDAPVSLGEGEELYGAVYERMLAELKSRANEGQLEELMGALRSIWEAAGERHRARVKKDVTSFAFSELPAIQRAFHFRHPGLAASAAGALRQFAGARAALEFLIAQAESEPDWPRLRDEDLWSRQGNQIAILRKEAGPLDAPLEERLLQIVLRELRRNLSTGRDRGRGIYRAKDHFFWKEKADDFVRAALELLKRHERSGSRVWRIAEYLYRGLNRRSEAIEALLEAYRKGILEAFGQSWLGAWLGEQGRHAEAVPILADLAARNPEVLGYRIALMRAHYHDGDGALLVKTLEEAERSLRGRGEWKEENIASLGEAALETRLHEAAAAYYREAIALHRRAAPIERRGGAGDETLRGHYRRLAEALSGLGKTAEAVEAACGAIVSWGPRSERRQEDLLLLEKVLASAPDLEAYAARLDAEAEQSGLENPAVRKALGRVYLAKGNSARAAEQLRLALGVQPADVEAHRLLIEAYDQMGAGDRAAAQLREAAALSGHRLELFQELGGRLAGAGQAE
ncbi:MAG: hypothetical protein HY717_14725 [Planctomycetes bacterium]|nr:hypothetical protein [Planctomycetota bacterium]